MIDLLLERRKRVQEELAGTQLVSRAMRGEMDRDVYIRYLANARYYAQFSPVLMALGASRLSASHPELSRYLLKHAADEQGHDAWALEDLRELGVEASEALATRPVPACSALVGYVHFLAGHANPVALFGWMYVLEAVGDDLGAKIGERLLASLGESRSAVRFVVGHGVADVAHTEEITDQIRRSVLSPEDRRDLLEAADVVADLYHRMFREIGGEQAAWPG